MKIILQPRPTERKYIYDYVASVNYRNRKKATRTGSGLSVDKKTAKNRAVYEALERYFGSLSSNHFNSYPIKTLEKRGINFLNPKWITSFDTNTKRANYRFIKSGTILEWVKGWSYLKKAIIHVPAFAVFLNYDARKNNKFARTTSCGLSLHKTPVAAITHSILELVERDAAMLVWLTKRKVPRIDMSNIHNNRISKLVLNVKKENLIPMVFLSSIDLNIPSVIAAIYDPKNKIPVITFGLASDFDINRAILKSLEEAIMIRNTLDILKLNGRLRKIKKSDIKCFLDHVKFYSFPSNNRYWKFLLGSKMYSLSNLVKKYGFERKLSYTDLIKNFSNKGMEVIAIEIANKYLKNVKLNCVRVIIKELCQMYPGSGVSPTNKESIRKRLKNKSINFNNHPHPFG